MIVITAKSSPTGRARQPQLKTFRQGRVGQSVERHTEKTEVPGSMPDQATYFRRNRS